MVMLGANSLALYDMKKPAQHDFALGSGIGLVDILHWTLSMLAVLQEI